MARSVIVSAVRTPYGKLGGALKDYEAVELGAIAIRGPLERAGLEPHEIEYVLMGQVLQGVAGQHLRDAEDVVEPHEDVGDEEAAFRKPGARVRQRDGRLELCHVVVREVADHRCPGAFGLGQLGET